MRKLLLVCVVMCLSSSVCNAGKKREYVSVSAQEYKELRLFQEAFDKVHMKRMISICERVKGAKIEIDKYGNKSIPIQYTDYETGKTAYFECIMEGE